MPIEDITWALENLAERSEAYALYNKYYDGEHRLDYVPADYRQEFAALLRRLKMNLCPAVVDALNDRLKLTGFTSSKAQDVKDEKGRPKRVDPLGDKINGLWRGNWMDQRQREVSLEALKTGDAFCIVWPNPSGKVTIYPQTADTMAVYYNEDEPGRLDRAAKVWTQKDKRVRVTLYYPDAIERYISKAKGRSGMKARDFVKFTDESDPNGERMNRWGQVPVFHFGNNTSVGKLGKSELVDVIPLNDALNKMYRDTLVNGDLHALRQRYATGVEVMRDEHGKPINPFVSGELWATANKDAKFGDLPASDLKPFVDVKQSFILDVAIVTGTPLHYFYIGGGTPPSGEALKTAEGRLTSRADSRMTAFGNVWEEVWKLALKMGGTADEDLELDAVWANTVPRDDAAHQTSVIERKNELKISRRQALREVDYTDEEIDRMDDEVEVEAKDETLNPPPEPAVMRPGQMQPQEMMK